MCVLNIVIKHKQIHVVNKVKVTLPGDIVRLKDGCAKAGIGGTTFFPGWTHLYFKPEDEKTLVQISHGNIFIYSITCASLDKLMRTVLCRQELESERYGRKGNQYSWLDRKTATAGFFLRPRPKRYYPSVVRPGILSPFPGDRAVCFLSFLRALQNIHTMPQWIW